MGNKQTLYSIQEHKLMKGLKSHYKLQIIRQFPEQMSISLRESATGHWHFSHITFAYADNISAAV